MKEENVKGKKIYIAGKITGLDRTEAIRNFGVAEELLREMGAVPFNPTCLPKGFTWQDYMTICLEAVKFCDAVYMLSNWRDSPDANKEHDTARMLCRKIYYE